jgi:hypothetical protein
MYLTDALCARANKQYKEVSNVRNKKEIRSGENSKLTKIQKFNLFKHKYVTAACCDKSKNDTRRRNINKNV